MSAIDRSVDVLLERRGIAALVVVLGVTLGLCSSLAAVAAPAADEPALTRDEARRVESPVPYTPEAVREGRKHYLRLCQNCHGKDGRALESIDFEATDLTDPERYRHGSTDGDLFFSTREGAGNDMPPFRDKLSDQQVWEVVWFLRSLGPESAQPQAAPAAAAPGASASPSATSSQTEESETP